MNLKDFIRSIPDYPKKGILFRDITTLIKDEKAFAETVSPTCPYEMPTQQKKKSWKCSMQLGRRRVGAGRRFFLWSELI